MKQVWLRLLVQPKVNQGTGVSFFTIPYKTFSSANNHHSIIALAAVSTSLKIVRPDVENTHTPYLYKRVSDTLTRFSLSYGQLDRLIALPIKSYSTFTQKTRIESSLHFRITEQTRI